MTREQIIDLFFKNDKIIAARTSEQYLRKHNYYNMLINYYLDSSSIRETLYRIYHNIDERPVCKICKKPVSFVVNGYFSTYCSRKCQNSDPEMIQKNSKGVSKSLLKAYEERGDEIKRKRSNSLEKHFGQKVETPFAIKEIQNKVSNTIYNKYGVKNVFQLKQYRETRQQMQNRSIQLQKKLGYDIQYINDADKLKVKVFNCCEIHGDVIMDWNVFNRRTRLTRKMFTTLCPICNPVKNLETTVETIIKKLLEKYQIKYILHEHKLIKPYELDFYLPDYNIAIECNGCYWHSGYQNYLKHEHKLKLCSQKNIKLIYYWSYQVYNNLHDVEIDLLNQLNIENENNYLNNILKIDNDITYMQFSIINNLNIDTKYVAIPIDKDIFCSNESIESIPYFVNYRDEQISLEFNNKCVICYSTKFNLYSTEQLKHILEKRKKQIS